MTTFGVVVYPDPPSSRLLEMAVRVEEAGFDAFWTYDSPVLWQEPFVLYSQILARTSRITVGPLVTNPVTRDWTETASFFATLNEMYGPRTVCGIGRGDSAVRVVGRAPASIDELGRAVVTIKNLAEGRQVEHHGTAVRLSWVEQGSLPVWSAGFGPRALRVAGEYADGLVFGLGHPDVVRWAVNTVRAAASDAGRDPDALEICLSCPAYVGDDLAHQREQLRWFGGMVGNHAAELAARYGDSGTVPTELTDFVRDRTGYDYAEHGRTSNTMVDYVSDQTLDRFCLLGTVADHVARLGELIEAGVTHFALQMSHDGHDETIAAYGQDIIPAIKSSARRSSAPSANREDTELEESMSHE